MRVILKFTAAVSDVHITEAPYDPPSVRKNSERDAKNQKLSDLPSFSPFMVSNTINWLSICNIFLISDHFLKVYPIYAI